MGVRQSKIKTKTKLIIILSVIFGVCFVVGGIFALRGLWKHEILNEIAFPSTEQSVTLKLHQHGFSDGRKYSRERVIRYNPSQRGLWFHVTNGFRTVFAYDDMVCVIDDDSAENEASGEGVDFYEVFSIDELQSEMQSLSILDFSILDDLHYILLGKPGEALDGAWKWFDSYAVTLDGDYLAQNHFNGMKKSEYNEYYGFRCNITAHDGVFRSIRMAYSIHSWNYLDFYRVRHSSEINIDLEIEEGADFSGITLPEAFLHSQSRLGGNLLKDATSYSDELAEVSFVTLDDAVHVYTHQHDYWDSEVSVYAHEELLALTAECCVELYDIRTLRKLYSFEFFTDISHIDIADGKLAVLVSGSTNTGSYELDYYISVVSWVYIYDLDTLAEVGRYDIGNAVSGDISDFVYDGEDAYFVCNETKYVIDTSGGEVSTTDSIPDSLQGLEGGSLAFVQYTPDAAIGYPYKAPVNFVYHDYVGYSFGGYDIIEVLSQTKALGLYDREDNEYDYLFPLNKKFGYGQHFVCSLGNKKYLCFIGFSLFTIDMNKMHVRQYNSY